MGKGFFALQSKVINQIQESPIKDFKAETITKVFPEYYSKYQKELTEIKRALADIRANKIPEKVIQQLENNDFKSYLTQIERLIEISDAINANIVAIQNFYKIDVCIDYVDNLNRTYDIDLLTKVIPDYAKLRQEFNKIKKQNVTEIDSIRLKEIYDALSEQESDLKIQFAKKNNDWWRKEIVIKILIAAIVSGLIGYAIRAFFESQTTQPTKIENKIDSTKTPYLK